MYRKEWRDGTWIVRYDGTETKIDINGNPTLEELESIIMLLMDAKNERIKFNKADKEEIERQRFGGACMKRSLIDGWPCFLDYGHTEEEHQTGGGYKFKAVRD